MPPFDLLRNMPNNCLDKWLQDVVSCKPPSFSLLVVLKFFAAAIVMSIMFYPLHSVLLPFVHEFGHYLAARITGVIPIQFIIGAKQHSQISFDFFGTMFFMGISSGGSHVVFQEGTKTCLIASAGPLATSAVAGIILVWLLNHRGRPISIMYVVLVAFFLDSLASSLVNLLSSHPYADGVFLRDNCFILFGTSL